MPGAALIMSFAIAVLTNGAVAEGNPAGDRFAVDEPEQQTEPNAPVCALTLDSFVNPDNAPPKVTTVNPRSSLRPMRKSHRPRRDPATADARFLRKAE